MAKKQKKRSVGRWILGVPILLGLGVLGFLGWQWMDSLKVETLAFAGVQHADTTALIALAQVDTGQVLYDIDPLLIEDRVVRHPWVEVVQVTRLPTGTLQVDAWEREPVVLVLDRAGRPAHYLDALGFAMPLVQGTAHDVPLLRGFGEAYHPIRQVQSQTVRELLGMLAALEDEKDVLISELEVRGKQEVWLHTASVPGKSSIPVRLGRQGFAEKMDRLHAFWHQAILTQTDKTFKLIDLRFDSQVVTKEAG